MYRFHKISFILENNLNNNSYIKPAGIYFSETDPQQVHRSGRGVFNIIDLANAHSIGFIATDDMGVLHPDGSFEVWGRMDNSDIRGCSLMAP